ncbi:helix-turn-helix transcriptional regulator [Agrobacterium tumefaciens]|uniref:helix-turn-helix domain-containing protein n=1 Tax=Agrobacterium tumefaciens TaxID=358 RepID=UPI001573111C|nr:helix-turn-helix transcriptional regulator [Agrobacterium tumefaciens]
MKLEQYLTQNNIKPVAFAASIDVAPSTITRIVKGERTPRIDLIAKIKAATGGLVTMEDWMQPLTSERLDAMFEEIGRGDAA